MKWFGMLRRMSPLRLFGGYFGRHPWQKRLLILAPFLLLLALLNPVLGAVDTLFGLVGRVFGPLLETGLGRAIFVVVLAVLGGVLVFAVAKDRVLDVVRRYALSLLLRGSEAQLVGQRERAVPLLRRVVRLGRWFDLSKGLVAAHGALDADAHLKLARIWLDEGDVRRAASELARVPKAGLKKRLRLSLAELQARVFAAHPDHLADSALGVLEESHKTWPAHEGIASLLSDRLLELGQGERAADVLAETLRRASKERTPRVGARLAKLYRDLAEAALHAGDAKRALKLLTKSLRLEESESGLLLRADIHLALGELDAALSVLSSLATPSAKQRIAQLLRHEATPLSPRQLMRQVPRKDSLVALAEHWIEQGELRRAGRALEVCLREGGASPRVLALLASVRFQESEPEEAKRTLRLALESLG